MHAKANGVAASQPAPDNGSPGVGTPRIMIRVVIALSIIQPTSTATLSPVGAA